MRSSKFRKSVYRLYQVKRCFMTDVTRPTFCNCCPLSTNSKQPLPTNARRQLDPSPSFCDFFGLVNWMKNLNGMMNKVEGTRFAENEYISIFLFNFFLYRNRWKNYIIKTFRVFTSKLTINGPINAIHKQSHFC